MRLRRLEIQNFRGLKSLVWRHIAETAAEMCCDLEGFSLHAKVAIERHDRTGLERLCR